MKYLISIREIHGSYECSTDYLTDEVDGREKEFMKFHRGFEDDDWDDDLGGFFNGEILVQFERYKEIPDEDYEVLKKYICII